MTTKDLDLSDVGTLKDDWLRLEDQLGSRPKIDLVSLPITTIRENIRKNVKSQSETSPHLARSRLDVKDRTVKRDDGETITVRVYKTPGSQALRRAVGVFYHGGGFVLGDLDREDSLCSTIADETGYIVVSVGYRHAPEHPYPVPAEDAYAGLLWVFDNLEELGGDPALVFTMGNSAGGNLATVVVRKLLNSRRAQQVAAQVLRIPNTCHPKALPEDIAGPLASYNHFTDAPILPTSVMNEFWSLYNVPEDEVRSVDCSPLLASDFKGFPPTYISVCGCDPLRDEGIAYARKLEQHGVPVKLDVIPGYPHGYFNWPQITASKEADGILMKGIEWAIEQAKANQSSVPITSDVLMAVLDHNLPAF